MKCTEVCPTKAIEAIGIKMTVEEVMLEVEKDIPFYDNSNGGLTLSGGEPLFQPDFSLELLKAAKQKGIRRAIETTGYAEPKTTMKVFGLCDQILFDVKQMDSALHKKYTGSDNDLIQNNLALAAEEYAERIIVRVPFIEGVNASEKDVDSLISRCLELGIEEIHLLPYHELGKAKYEKLGREYGFDGSTPSEESLERTRMRIVNKGIRCVIRG